MSESKPTERIKLLLRHEAATKTTSSTPPWRMTIVGHIIPPRPGEMLFPLRASTRAMRRLLLLAIVAMVLTLAAGSVGWATPSAAAAWELTNTGLPRPDSSKPTPDPDNLPGMDGNERTPETDPPRSYYYINPAEELRGLLELPEPSDREFSSVGLDYKQYTKDPMARAMARYNVYVDEKATERIQFAQGLIAKKPRDPLPWNKWLKKWIPNQGNDSRGKGYEKLANEALGFNGNPDWVFQETIHDAPEARTYDAVNHRLKIAYEYKSGNKSVPDQVRKDQANVTATRYRIGYVFGADPNPSVIQSLKSKGFLVHVLEAQWVPKQSKTLGQEQGQSPGAEGPLPSQAGAIPGAIAESPASLEEAEETAAVGAQLAAESDAPDQAPADPGGIDFSTLELRYLADTDSDDGPGLRYGFAAHATAEGQLSVGGLQAAQQASDSLFVWIGLPTSKFWVNLNPHEPDRIIDAQLGRTDAGRILLEADLQMKKTVAQLIHPDTPLGAQFWAALNMGGESGSWLSFRQWIVPAPATIRNDHGALYILDAPLLVQLESEYIELRGDSSHPTSCAPQKKSVEQHNEAVFRSMILPRVQQAVNEAPEYAELRRVYLSRVAAEWYRQRNVTTFAGLIDSGDITPWVSRQPWSPQDVFDRYVQSYTNGEFNVTRETRQGNVIETTTYVFGGVDFMHIPFHSLSAGDFQSEWPDLSSTVERAFDRPTTDEEGKVWLGSMSVVPGFQHGSKIGLSGYLFLAIIGVAAAVSTRSWRRLRRARRDWARANTSAPSR